VYDASNLLQVASQLCSGSSIYDLLVVPVVSLLLLPQRSALRYVSSLSRRDDGSQPGTLVISGRAALMLDLGAFVTPLVPTSGCQRNHQKRASLSDWRMTVTGPWCALSLAFFDQFEAHLDRAASMCLRLLTCMRQWNQLPALSGSK
jgi:hypothetical protein